ncbi:heterogeneous nuclear ribonucleoprotein U protein 1 [Biomphalaria glabrata]|nr:heterogeneous nuclear ribonucleoprotein U protein 1 [Biomphalaria glabrata]
MYTRARAAQTQVVLDRYNSDLNMCITPNGLSAYNLNSPKGFRLLWAGAKATHGVCQGRVMFEVKITEYLQSKTDIGFSEPHPSVVRVGWSEDSPSFSLGEGGESFGYGGLGKLSYRNTFRDYGAEFGLGDVITALLDLDSSPGTIAFMKNGLHLGTAYTLSKSGKEVKALFPHVSCKNAKFEVNFGQNSDWAPKPSSYKFIDHLPSEMRIKGLEPSPLPYEVIMLVGLPGSGKTTWALQKQESEPNKRYNILGTDRLIDQFRVMGVARHSGYSDRFDLFFSMANECLNELMSIAIRHPRNYIIDQTNLYPSARFRKMKPFSNFRRIAVVIQPEIGELERRSKKRTQDTGKSVPANDIRKMKANYILPEDRDNIFQQIQYVGLDKENAQKLVIRYNQQSIG